MQMSNPTDVIISGINISINSFQFNSYAVFLGSIEVFCAKYQHSRHLSTSCHFNLKERQYFDHMIRYLANSTLSICKLGTILDLS